MHDILDPRRLRWLISAVLWTAATASADHQWGSYHWARDVNPFTLDLGSNVSSTWSAHVNLASDDWSLSSVLDTIVVSGTTDPARCAAWTGTVQVCDSAYGSTGWLGIAGISVEGEHITAGYVKLNDTYFGTTAYDTPAWRQMVTCQEIGHTFGLAHQDEDFSNPNLDTCMDYTRYPESNQHPNDHDYEMLETMYAHSDGGTGGGGGGKGKGGNGGNGGKGGKGGDKGCNPKSPKCSGQSAAAIMRELDMSDRRNWGRLVSEHGPQEIFELDLGHGRKILTHVTWTLEAAGDHAH